MMVGSQLVVPLLWTMDIITVKDILYQVLGKMDVDKANEKGTEYWKEKYNANSVLRNGNFFYFCMTIIDAEFEDI